MKKINSVSEYEQLVKGDQPLLLDFYADWCGPCQSLMPVMEDLSNEYGKDVIIAKVNVDENPQLAQQFQVRSIPALFFVKDGQVKEKLSGVQTKKLLEEKITFYSDTLV